MFNRYMTEQVAKISQEQYDDLALFIKQTKPEAYFDAGN